MTFTIDVHHRILPDVFWRATNDAHNPLKLFPRFAGSAVTQKTNTA
jgi:hypothetical protein